MTKRDKEILPVRLAFWAAILTMSSTAIDSIHKVFNGVTRFKIDLSNGIVFPVWSIITIVCLLVIVASIIIYKKKRKEHGVDDQARKAYRDRLRLHSIVDFVWKSMMRKLERELKTAKDPHHAVKCASAEGDLIVNGLGKSFPDDKELINHSAEILGAKMVEKKRDMGYDEEINDEETSHNYSEYNQEIL